MMLNARTNFRLFDREGSQGIINAATVFRMCNFWQSLPLFVSGNFSPETRFLPVNLSWFRFAETG